MLAAERKARSDHENQITYHYINAMLSRAEKVPTLEKFINQMFPKQESRRSKLTDKQKNDLLRSNLVSLRAGKPKLKWADIIANT